MEKPSDQIVTMRVRIGDSELEVTGPVDFVEKKIAEFTKNAPKQTAVPTQTGKPSSSASAPVKQFSPGQFFKKSPQKSVVTRVLLAAYFLEKVRNMESITASEVRDVIREAKVPPPENVNDAINQNIRKGFMMSAGNKDSRIAFVLTSDGEEAASELIGNSGE